MDKLRLAATQALEALEEIALAGMSPAPEMIDNKEAFHARQAWRFIGIAARQLTALRTALAEQPAEQEPKHDDPIGDAQDKLIAEQAARPYKVGGLCVPTQTGPCAEGEDTKGTCIRCGKPFNSVDDIHICTPPRALALAEQPAEQRSDSEHMEPVATLYGTLPVYNTAPQPRREVELTDDAITHMAAQSLLYEENPPQGFDAAVRSFARAVIEAYKAKQGEKA